MTLGPVLPNIENELQPALISLLNELGVDRVSHSGRTLLDHLVSTSRILAGWDCRPALCTAGLFHSIYGTEMFRVATRSHNDRTSLQQTISVEAENLVYLYGTITRQSLYDAAQSSENPMVVNFRTGLPVPITAAELADLFTLDLANTLEHSPRMYLRPEFMDIYRRAGGILPASALKALDGWAEAARKQSMLQRHTMRARFYAGWLWVYISSAVRGLARPARKHT